MTWGVKRVISLPLKNIFPDVGFNSPVMTLKRVVFPAPFGPMIPLTSPSWTEQVTLSRAVKPPKRIITETVSRSLFPEAMVL
jgi:hypothetical protein